MTVTTHIFMIAALFSFLIWLYLLFFRGTFWRTDIHLSTTHPEETNSAGWPRVSVIVPARDEAETIPGTLPDLLRQHYPGPVQIILVDDQSSDGTGELARTLAGNQRSPHPVTVIRSKPLQKGWTGKLWAIQQGVIAAEPFAPDYYLFTDADISHPPASVTALVAKAETERLDLVSVMVKLKISCPWERLLIPAFVYFFAKLYPFSRVNSRNRPDAAAAGGCVLIRRRMLEHTGGLEAISTALIDDVVLARQVQRAGGDIWLGLTRDLISLRSYGGIRGVWQMVTRTAYTQLHHSLPVLAATLLGMTILYLIPPAATVAGMVLTARFGLESSGLGCSLIGILAWTLMTRSFIPMLKWYDIGPGYAPLLPAAGLIYTLMTIDSAVQHHRGRGGLWKGRVQDKP